jgi:hypothetical protein
MATGIENAVHSLVERMFPFRMVDGWGYKGFSLSRDGTKGYVVNLRFEKLVMGRMGFAILHVPVASIKIPGFDLKAWVSERLCEQEEHLTTRFINEFAGAA